MSRRLAQVSIRRPRRVLAVAGLVLAAAVPGLLRLELRTDGRALVPTSAAEVAVDRQVRERFDLRDPIAVVLRSDHPNGIFNTGTLRRVQRITEAARGLEGVRPFDVVSLATEPGFRHKRGLITLANLLDPFPESRRQLDRLSSDLHRLELYDGTLVSHDSSATAVLIGLPPEADPVSFVEAIRQLVDDSGTAQPAAEREATAVLGAAVAEGLLGRHILADLGVPEAVSRAEHGATGQAPGPEALRWSISRRIGMVPVAITVMGLVFLAAFRRLAAALLPLAEVGFCLLVVFGVMGWLGVPIYLTTSVLPVIVTALGVADEVHIFRRYLDLRRERASDGLPHRELVGAALDEMAAPVTHTSLTTAVAFLSFTLSPLGPVRAFGLFTAFGVLVCMVFSLTVIPALIVLLGSDRWLPRRHAGPGNHRQRAFTWLARLGARRGTIILAATLLLALVATDGARRVRVQDSWIGGFAGDSAFARWTRWFDEQFLGSHLLRLAVEAESFELAGETSEKSLEPFELSIEATVDNPARLEGGWVRVFQLGEDRTDRPARPPREWATWIEAARIERGRLRVTLPRLGGSPRFWLRPGDDEILGYEIRTEPFTAPATLRRVAALESFLAVQPGVGGVLGPARYLETVAFMLRPDDDGSRALPQEPRRARILWSNYGVVRGRERLAQLVDEGYRAALVTVFLEDANFVDTAGLLERIDAYERAELHPHGIRLSVGGDTAVSQALIDAVVATQVRSLLLSLLGILAAAALLGRSLRAGITCVIPPAIAVVASFAVMGWLGIPLGVATSMFAGMTLGVGVDFSIHLLARFRRGERQGLPPTESLAAALATTGPAILIDALAVGLGFGALVLSQVPANARLGGLLIASVLGCLLATAFVVPALLARRPSTQA